MSAPDFASKLIGLLNNQENRYAYYTNPQAIQGQLDQGVKNNLAINQQKLSQQHLNLEAQNQAFNQDIRTKQMAISQDQYAYQKKLNDLMFPLQQQEIQDRISLLPDTYEAQKLDLQSKKNAALKTISSRSLSSTIANQMQTFSQDDWDNGVPESLIAQHRADLTDSDAKALDGIIEQRQNTLTAQTHKQQILGAQLWQQQMDVYNEQLSAVDNVFDRMPFASSEARATAKMDYLKNNGLLTPPSRAPFSFGSKGQFNVGNPPSAGRVGGGKVATDHTIVTGSTQAGIRQRRLLDITKRYPEIDRNPEAVPPQILDEYKKLKYGSNKDIGIDLGGINTPATNVADQFNPNPTNANNTQGTPVNSGLKVQF